jgi:hypothetical protein
MPKTFKTTKVTGKRLPVSMRIGDDTRVRLEKAATRTGRSLIAEIEIRLARSFSDEDVVERILGGPKVRRLAEVVISSFVSSARLTAEASRLPDSEAWMEDRDSFRAGMLGAFEALMSMMPGAMDSQTLNLEIEALKSRILSRLIISGRIPAPQGGK